MFPVSSRAPSLVSALLSLSVTLPVLAQGGAPVAPSAVQTTTRTTAAAPAQSRRPTWKVRRIVEIASEYDDNVFLLPDSRKPDLDPPSTASTASGRYVGMRSSGDVITTLSMLLAVRGPGIGGRALSIRPEAGIAYYAQNADRRSIALGLALDQELPHRSRLRIAGATTPSYFARNYLVDAVDANGDGTIAASERRYRQGTYRETSLDLEYHTRLDKSSKKSPFGADLELGGGWYSRAYDAPFRGRDVNGPVLNAGLLLTVSRSFDLDVRYRLEALSATPTPQVMVLDEIDVGRDLNANGSTTDDNVRIVSTMDRSHTEHVAGVRGKFLIGSRGDLRLEVDRRWRTFSSEQPLDLANFGRRDSRNTGSAEFTYPVARDMRLSARGELASQRLRRGGDAGLGEIDDYTRRRLSFGVRYEF
jgi:hypothetical protein